MRNNVASPIPAFGAAAGSTRVLSAARVVSGVGLGEEHPPNATSETIETIETIETRGNQMERFIATDVSGRSSIRSTHRSSRSLILSVVVLAACSKTAPNDSDATATTEDTAGLNTRPPILVPRLAELQVEDATPEDIRPFGFDTDLRALAETAFYTSFERAPDDPSACRASVAIGYALVLNNRPVTSAEVGEAHAFFEGEVFCPDPDTKRPVEGFRLRLDLDRPFGAAHGITGPVRLRDVVGELTRDGADALFGQVRVRYFDDAAIRAALATSDHPGILAEAASEAGERRLADASLDLARLTAHANRRVAIRAGAALGLLRRDDPETIKALVRLTEGPDTEKHLVAVHALADIGTAETRRYLEVIAVGHPNPTIRQLARERLGMKGSVVEEPAPEPVPDPIP